MTPNNSDQAAMHDELRARLIRDADWLTEESAFLGAYAGSISNIAKRIREFAALTLPASEAVAWLHKNGYSLLLDSGMHHATNPEDWTPLYTTPQPAPAAHAGGEEAVATVIATPEETHPHASGSTDLQWHSEWEGFPVGTKLYTQAPSPMPVDALRELIDAAVKAGRELDEYGALTSAQAVMDAVKKARALLSGGAAREGA